VDEKKNRVNVRKHGPDFFDAEAVFDGDCQCRVMRHEEQENVAPRMIDSLVI
jgi:uncharacterized DUF497 family protein